MADVTAEILNDSIALTDSDGHITGYLVYPQDLAPALTHEQVETVISSLSTPVSADDDNQDSSALLGANVAVCCLLFVLIGVQLFQIFLSSVKSDV